MKSRRLPCVSCCAKKCMIPTALLMELVAFGLGKRAENSLAITTRADAKRKYLGGVSSLNYCRKEDLQDKRISMRQILLVESSLNESNGMRTC